MKRTIVVRQGSLTDGRELLLVNASNTNARLGSGVSGAIRAACGPGYQEHIVRALVAAHGGPMVPGQTLITDAGAHPTARHVAHVAVMDYRQGFGASSFPDLERIETCCKGLWEAIETVDESGPISVAMVALGAGTGQLGVRAPTEIACRTLKEHLGRRPQSKIGDVTFYGYQLTEYIAMVDVVSAFFDLPEGSVPEEIREHLRRTGAS